MAREISLGANYPNNDTTASAGTTQLLAAGGELSTFAVPVRYVTVSYVSHDVWIAKTSAEVAATAAGAKDDRIFVKGDTRGLTIPWDGQNVYYVNAVTGETPSIYVVGHV